MLDAVAIVTGGAYEEGLSAGEALLRAGATVSLWDDDSEKLAQAQRELAAQGFRPDIRKLDVADWTSVSAAYQAVRSTVGPVHALVNFATLKNTFLLGEHNQRAETTPPFWEVDVHRTLRVLAVNVLGTYLCMRAAMPDMVRRGSGSIVNLSTSPHTQRSADHIPYGPSKALVDALSLAAAEQLAPYGVRVNVISSGGRVNRRGKTDPNAQPSNWMAPLLEYLVGAASTAVTGRVVSATEFVVPAS